MNVDDGVDVFICTYCGDVIQSKKWPQGTTVEIEGTWHRLCLDCLDDLKAVIRYQNDT